MPMTKNNGLAADAIKTIHDLWMVDPDRVRWVGDSSASTILREGYGFDWWPGDFKVEVRVYGPHPEIEYPIYRISVRTDLLCNVDVTTTRFPGSLSDLNGWGSPFAICAHPTTLWQSLDKYEPLPELGLDLKSSKVWLASTAYVHEGIKAWLPRLFAGLAVLQSIEAQFRADALIPLLGGRADRSRPSASASQTNLDEILGIEEAMIAPFGQQQSRWIDTGEFEEIINRQGRCDYGFGTTDKGGLTIEMPFFGEATAVLALRTDMPHPRLGNGLRAILKLPRVSGFEDTNALSIEMNYLEDRLWSKVGVPFIGSWSARAEDALGEPGFVPSFRVFVPNLAYERGLAENFVLYAMGRARWFRQLWLPDAVDLPMHEILSRRLDSKESQ